jgi:hypothetical protein
MNKMTYTIKLTMVDDSWKWTITSKGVLMDNSEIVYKTPQLAAQAARKSRFFSC